MNEVAAKVDMMTAQSPFDQKRTNILHSLSLEPANYTDLSPKGSVDEPIRHLINLINHNSDLVTTSSCSGRVSVFLEGSGSGGKGGGGRWLFVSHDPLDLNGKESWTERFGLHPSAGNGQKGVSTNVRHVHLKFEPMILHILCRNATVADKLLKCAQGAGFRESGASNVPGDERTPVNVAIRMIGLAMDNIVGYAGECSAGGEAGQTCRSCVSEEYLFMLARIVSARFHANLERMERLKQHVEAAFGKKRTPRVWESFEARRDRKRREGLERQAALSQSGGQGAIDEMSHDNEDLQGVAEFDGG